MSGTKSIAIVVLSVFLPGIHGGVILSDDQAVAPAKISQLPHSIVVKRADGGVVVAYQLVPPADGKLSVESGGYFHPLATPRGTVVTDFAPDDHPHHRGVFLAWVEMHGAKDADFWGWGEHAPKQDRRIVNREVSTHDVKKGMRFTARNEWLAEGTVLLVEELRTDIRVDGPATVLDLVYTLTPPADLTLSRWAFSGFCLRARKDGSVEAFGPGGKVELANPVHTQPETDWPSAAWYAYTLRLAPDQVASVAVIDHPANPRTLWHNHREIRMLNPAITARTAVVLKANEPLVLRYRVVASDGPTDGKLLDRLAAEWRAEK